MTYRQTSDRKPLTPAGRRAWAIFIAFCESRGISRSAGRRFIAEEMGIEHYYAMRDEMDDVEAATFAEICSEAMEKDLAEFAEHPAPRQQQRNAKRSARRRRAKSTAGNVLAAG